MNVEFHLCGADSGKRDADDNLILCESQTGALPYHIVGGIGELDMDLCSYHKARMEAEFPHWKFYVMN